MLPHASLLKGSEEAFKKILSRLWQQLRRRTPPAKSNIFSVLPLRGDTASRDPVSVNPSTRKLMEPLKAVATVALDPCHLAESQCFSCVVRSQPTAPYILWVWNVQPCRE